MFRHPLRYLLASLYASTPNPLSRIARFSYTETPSKSNFLPPISLLSLGSEIVCTRFGGEIAANASIISSKYSKSTIRAPSSLFSVQSLCTLPSQFSISATSHDLHENTSTSIADKVYGTVMSSYSSDQSMEQGLTALAPELTTELVNDVLHRLRYEEKLAFRFFTWAGHQDAYAHDPQNFNDMIEILSSTGFKTKQFGVTCDVLDYMKRKRKNSVPVEALLTILKTYAEKHLSGIGKFAKKKRIKPKIQPEVHSLNLLLDSLCKCSLVTEAESIFHRVKLKVPPTAETYNILFFGWCRVRDPEKAMNVLEEMLERGHIPESFTYNAAISSFCDAGMIKEAMELFEFMRTKGSTISSPTAKTYSVLIVALAKYDRMCLAGKIDAAYKILEEMDSNSYPPDILTYNCFLKVLCSMKKHEEALRLCEKMIEGGCEPSVHTYNMMITMFFKIEDSNRAFDMWLEMDKRECARSVDSYGIMIDGLFGCGRVEDACFLLDEVMDRGMKLPYKNFDSLMMRLSEIGNLRAIHRLSDHMRRFYNVAMARRFAKSQKKKSISMRRP
ncbi:Pentatricopeptide repeat-containing protein [Platanthera zijinensis]|uniref:Pentatricopeptide repeat-containing protein n=1 Tax=Platanthera zijinensis TaxID=2320716 RepID=A0AAP0B5L1_9ASPA